MESRRITTILKNQVRRAECGSVVQILKIELLEPELYERMRGEWIYGIVSNEDNIYPVTGSYTYQINWPISYLSIGKGF